jgi:hypothetical protein
LYKGTLVRRPFLGPPMMDTMGNTVALGGVAKRPRVGHGGSSQDTIEPFRGGTRVVG